MARSGEPGRRLAAAGVLAGLLLAAAGAAADTGRFTGPINSDWQFQLESDDGSIDETAWHAVILPHTWNDQDSLDKSQPYHRGKGRYRRSLAIDAALAQHRLYLYFEGANQVADVYVNGQHAGQHIGGYSAFAVEISDFVDPSGENQVEVRVDNRHDSTVPPLNADFTFYGGLYRDAWLLALADVHFVLDDYAASEFRIQTTEISARQATVDVTAVLQNDSARSRRVEMSTSLINPDGELIVTRSLPLTLPANAATGVTLVRFQIDQPQLWSPESPDLYRVISTVADATGVLDTLERPLGLRWFEIDAQTGFHLNGKPYRLIGTNRHQDHAGYGNALPNRVHVEDLQKIKEDGFNFLRLAHYPQDPAVLDAADELGLIVWEETPVVNLIDMSADFAANTERMVREMVRQHRHHPSVVFWGYMNEVTLRKPDPVPAGYYDALVDLAGRLDRVVGEEDPSRPTVMALSRDEVLDDIPLEAIADVLAFNLYFGWYYDDFAALGEFLDQFHRDNPDRPLMISEYGAGGDERIHAIQPRPFDFSTEHQQRFHEASLVQILERPWLVGTAVWNQFDFGSSHRQDTKFGINQKGLWYFDRKPKDVAWLYRASLRSEPVVHIATRDWALRAGSRGADATMPVRVYSNAEAVQLTINGRSQGVRNVADGVAAWDVTFGNGRNELVATGGLGSDATVVDYEDRSGWLHNKDTGLVLLVNAGSDEQFIDQHDRVWDADREYDGATWGYVDGSSERSHRRVFETPDDPLYQTRRHGSFYYRFDVADGNYCATLHRVDRETHRLHTEQRELHAQEDEGLVIEFGGDAGAGALGGIELQRESCDAGKTRAAAGEPDRPNIVFVLADDIGYGDVSVYGGSIATPNIDALAQAGMRFTDAHSPAALCAPSRFSLLTGSYPYRNGRPGGSWDINYSSGFDTGTAHLEAGRHVTVGEILQQAGYRTAFVGKMHLGGDVFDLDGQLIRDKDRLNEMDFSRGIEAGISAHGFDYALGLASGIQHEPYAYFVNGRYAPVDPADRADNSSTVLRMNGRYRVGSNGTSEIVEAGNIPARTDRKYDSSQVGPRLVNAALDFIDGHLEANRRDGTNAPFALYFSSQAIHVPHTPPVDFDGDPEPIDIPIAGVTGGATSDMILELDKQVGAIIDKLDNTGLLENTLVIFTSDNGALKPTITDYGDSDHDSNGPWRDYKASVYEGGHRVPFIVRWGDGTLRGSRIAPGSVADQTIVTHDWVATTYELTSQPMSPQQAMDSASLLPVLLEGVADPVHEFILYQAGFAQHGAIREGPWVLVVDQSNHATELYNLDDDPAQASNLIDAAVQRQRVERLLQTYLRHNDRDDSTFDEPRTTAPVVVRAQGQ